MKAAQIKEFGHADAIEINEIQKPIMKPSMVLIEVKASSLNPIDTAVREGYTQSWAPVELPVTLGGDVAGVIKEIGEGVEGFSVGDKVYGQANALSGASGALAQFALTSAEQIAKMPTNLSFEEAASLPLVGVSALQGLRDTINLQSGQNILIQGGAGGIGTVAVQLAKHLGAHVTVSTGAKAVGYVKDLGADEVIDYKTQDVDKDGQFDAVFDMVGGEAFEKSFKVVKKGGKAVSMAAQSDEQKSTELSISIIGQNTQVNTAALDDLTKLIEQGVVTPHVDKTYSLGETSKAFEARENESVVGKIVVSI